MDFAKFVHMIDTKKLWFARQDQFEDPLEGTYTDGELKVLSTLALGSNPIKGHVRIPELMRRSNFVNCWRSGPHESLAMWDLYGKGSGIVAVKSTVALLKEALEDFTRPVFIAKVDYVDWSQASWSNNGLVMCARKDISYQHEGEVRAMIWGHDLVLVSSPPGPDDDPNWEKTLVRAAEAIPVGLPVPFDSQRFLTEVVVGPREQRWVAPLVENVMKIYGLPHPVSISNRLTTRTK